MSKYRKLTGVILKKQNYKEADQILTLWTKELGKYRMLAKGVRASRSKLVYQIQDLSVVKIETVKGRGLPTLISARMIRNFKNLKTDLTKMAAGFYCAELMLKITADEHPNEAVFDLLCDFLHQLNLADISRQYPLIDSFSLNLAQTLGFGSPKITSSHLDVRKFIEDLIERNLKSEAFLASV